MTLSIVIPTKNRPNELLAMLKSLIIQTHLPDQIIIVDQSLKENTIEDKLLSLLGLNKIKLNYIHDQNITGLVKAKAFAIKHNTCDIISFFDDDIILEPGYLKEICFAFKQYPKINGANGLILNTPNQNIIKRLIYRFTHLGLYKDNRQRVSKQCLRDNLHTPIHVNNLSGGLSSWRSEVFKKVKFDVLNKFHCFEDVEYSIRFEKKFPDSMFLIPGAKLYHFHATGNRESKIKQISNHVEESILLFRKNNNFSNLGIDLLLIVFYFKINAIFHTIKHKEKRFIISFFNGIKSGLSKKIKKN
mgnify:FL=1|jgi:GT2 family glycosyltransferase